MEEKKTLEIGADVRIIQPKRMPRSRENNPFYQTYGQILALRGNHALVIFPNEFIIHFGGKFLPIAEFPVNDIQRFSVDTVPDIARKRVSNPFNYSFLPLPYRFTTNNTCMCEECKDAARERILYGSADGTQIGEYDVCKKHALLKNQKGVARFKTYSLQEA